MKKLFLILIPVVLLFTGCHNDNYVTIYQGRDKIDEIEPLKLTDKSINFIAKTAVEQNRQLINHFDKVVTSVDMDGKRYVYTIMVIEDMRKLSSAYNFHRTNKLWSEEMQLEDIYGKADQLIKIKAAYLSGFFFLTFEIIVSDVEAILE